MVGGVLPGGAAASGSDSRERDNFRSEEEAHSQRGIERAVGLGWRYRWNAGITGSARRTIRA